MKQAARDPKINSYTIFSRFFLILYNLRLRQRTVDWTQINRYYRLARETIDDQYRGDLQP